MVMVSERLPGLKRGWPVLGAAWALVSERLPGLKRGWPVPGAAWLRSARSRPPGFSLLLHERAVTLVEGAEGLLGGDGRADLVVVPGVLGLRRLLDLDQVGRVDLAAV